MKFQLLSTAVFSIVIIISSCKNDKKTTASDSKPTAEVPAEGVDTVFGIKGADKIRMKIVSPLVAEYKSQRYNVKTESLENTPGEAITVTSAEGIHLMTVPNFDAHFFHGLCSDFMFVDKGTSPQGRELMVFDLRSKAQVWQAKVADDSMLISSNNKLWYWIPVEESQVTKMPDCPEKDKWKAGGLGVGYAKRQIYDLVNRSVVSKSEFKCLPLQ